MTKLILAMCVVNEGKFIGQALQKTKRIKDIDLIHVLDGYWWHPRIEEKIKKTGTLNSSDDTMKQVIENAPHKLQYYASEMLYLSESDKRNFQLEQIDVLAKQWKEPYYVMILDGDEEIVFADDSPEEIYLKPILENSFGMGMVLCEGYGFEEQRFTGRIFQGGIGIHYHTGKPMCLHDHLCNIINDYQKDESDRARCYPITLFKLTNYWTMKGKERILEKDSLIQVQKTKPIRACDFRKV